jgi:hypothetical protein
MILFYLKMLLNYLNILNISFEKKNRRKNSGEVALKPMLPQEG